MKSWRHAWWTVATVVFLVAPASVFYILIAAGAAALFAAGRWAPALGLSVGLVAVPALWIGNAFCGGRVWWIRARDRALRDVGRVSRLSFFAGGAALLIAGAWSVDRSVFDTPLAQITLNQIGAVILKTSLWIAAWFIWFRWAFHSGEKPYRAWAVFGVIGVTFAALLAAAG